MQNAHLRHRRHLLPYLAKKFKAKTYLEIGVKGGKTFLPIKVRSKFAVDPFFRIKKEYKRSQFFKYPFNAFAKYFECTSDEFFTKYAASVLKKNSLDLCFIDGLHTYEQTFKDVVNTLPYLSKNGVMVIHDCSPMSSSAAFPAQSLDEVKQINPPGFDGMWSGDVWKLIPRLKIEFPDHTVFVLNHDSGLGIVSKRDLFNNTYNPSKLDCTTAEIDRWDYTYLERNRSDLLNITDDEFILKNCTLFK